MSKKRYEVGSRNVFKDLGLPNAEEHMVKAQLMYKIDTIMKDRGLKQAEAADLLGIKQPDVSKMLRGEFRQFSVERLLRFLLALDQDVGIVVKPHCDRGNAPAMQVFRRLSPWRAIGSGLTEEDGMKAPCAVKLHNTVTASQQRLGKHVAQL